MKAMTQEIGDIEGCGCRHLLREMKIPGFCSEGFIHRCDIRELQHIVSLKVFILCRSSVSFWSKGKSSGMLSPYIGEAKGLFSERCT